MRTSLCSTRGRRVLSEFLRALEGYVSFRGAQVALASFGSRGVVVRSARGGNLRLTQLESELLLIWFRVEMTPSQREKLRQDMPRAYQALMAAVLVEGKGSAANLNSQPLKRPSARRVLIQKGGSHVG